MKHENYDINIMNHNRAN